MCRQCQYDAVMDWENEDTRRGDYFRRGRAMVQLRNTAKRISGRSEIPVEARPQTPLACVPRTSSLAPPPGPSPPCQYQAWNRLSVQTPFGNFWLRQLRTRTRTRTRTHTATHACTHAHMHARTHTATHACTHAHMHARTHHARTNK